LVQLEAPTYGEGIAANLGREGCSDRACGDGKRGAGDDDKCFGGNPQSELTIDNGQLKIVVKR